MTFTIALLFFDADIVVVVVQDVAVKVILPNEKMSDKELAEFKAECQLMTQLRPHRNGNGIGGKRRVGRGEREEREENCARRVERAEGKDVEK